MKLQQLEIDFKTGSKEKTLRIFDHMNAYFQKEGWAFRYPKYGITRNTNEKGVFAFPLRLDSDFQKGAICIGYSNWTAIGGHGVFEITATIWQLSETREMLENRRWGSPVLIKYRENSILAQFEINELDDFKNLLAAIPSPIPPLLP